MHSRPIPLILLCISLSLSVSGRAANGVVGAQDANGLSVFTKQVTFSEFDFPPNSLITTQFQSAGVRFFPVAYYAPTFDQYPGTPNIDPTASVGNFVQYFGTMPQLSILFETPVTAASFALQSQPGEFDVTLFYKGQEVPSGSFTFVGMIGYGAWENLVSLRGAEFDEIRLHNVQTYDRAAVIDNIRFLCADGSLAQFPLNGNAVDLGFGRRDGTVQGAIPVPDRNGMPGSALQFDGVDDFVRVTNALGLPRGRSEFTVALWISIPPESAAREHKFLLTVDGFEQWQFFLSSFTDGRPANIQSLEFYTGGERIGGTPNLSWEFGRWYHIAFVRRSGPEETDTIEWYRDGQFIHSVATTVGNEASDEEMPLTVGRRLNGYGPWVGKMDDLRIFGRALSSNEIAQLMTKTDLLQIEISRVIRLDFKNLEIGSDYIVEASSDLAAWTNVGSSFKANANASTQFVNAEQSRRFFRAKKIVPSQPVVF